MKEPQYITTAIPYVNAPPHIGHALLFVYADVLARYQRLIGKDVKFLTGTDEHGQKIARKAAEVGKDPKAFVDEVSETVREMARLLEISHTDFIRTTEARHRATVEQFWKRVDERGWIYRKRYGGLYCVGCESFKTEKDLVNGLCPDHLKAPEYLEEENYFFKLSAFGEKLKTFFNEHPLFVVPDHRFQEMKQIVEDGLEDVSISRSVEHLKWGIPVPGDSSQVIYVWFDALVNYISGCGFVDDPETFQRYWPTAVHVIGKEINRFHSILWTAMLMAAELPLEHQVAVHGWITVDGQKMSKSLGNVIDPQDLCARFSVDGARYLLLRMLPFTGDGDFSFERAQAMYDANLANDLGNLMHRVMAMVQKYCDGLAPDNIPGDVSTVWETYQKEMQAYRFDQALEIVWSVIRDANQLVDREKPWVLAKEGKTEALMVVMYELLEKLRHVAWMIRPFMPRISDQMLDQLGVVGDRQEMTVAEISKWGGMEKGTTVKTGDPLFPKKEV